MTFTIGTISRCAGGQHVTIPVTVGAVTVNLQITLGQLQDAAPNSVDEAREKVIGRIRSQLLEQNAANWAQVQNALNGETFEI